MGRIHFVRTTEKTPFVGGSSLVWALQMLVASETLFLTSLLLVESEFPEFGGIGGNLWKCMALLALTILLFAVVAPAFGRFRLSASVVLELFYLAAIGGYAWRHVKQLYGGFGAMAENYLKAWNLYYKTNIIMDVPVEGESSFALTFGLVVLVLVCIMLCLITSLRWMMLLPPFAILVLGVLVERLPDWRGLGCLMLGSVFLYTGARESSGVTFVSVGRRGTKGRGIFGQLGVFVLAGVTAVVVVFITGLAFRSQANAILDKTPQFLAYQKELEEKVKNFQPVRINNSRQYVDNGTPEYKDELVLEICANEVPQSNLYLPDFYSGTYENGRWKQDSGAYRKAVREAGIDGDRLGTLAWQTPYELLGEKNNYWADSYWTWEYFTLDFKIHYNIRTNRALVPYCTDVAGSEGNLWVEDEGLVKKSASTDQIAFSAPNSNAEEILNLYNVVAMMTDMEGVNYLPEELQEVQSALDWYSGYVQEQYLTGSDLPAVQELASEILASEDCGRGTTLEEENDYRIFLAKAVQKRLAEEAEYNLYLDDIPAGTDTIQYFLETGHEGYCMHFASAGVLILQEMGVPARYASGYIAKQKAFEKDEKEADMFTAPVYDRNAHAWVEIYLEGVGWVPYEMTPNYLSTSADLPTDADWQESLRKKHENKETPVQEDSEAAEHQKESEAQTADSEESSGDSEASETENSEAEEKTGIRTEDNANLSGNSSQSKTGRWWKMVIGALGILVLVAGVCVGICCALRRYREVLCREIRRKQNRRAVRRINQRVYRRLQKGLIPAGRFRFGKAYGSRGAVHWSGMTDAEYEAKLVKTYPDISPEGWKRYMEIVKKAAFSREEISREEVALCYEIYWKR